VTDHTACGGSFAGLERAVAAALDGGVNVVQLRERELPARELYELGCRLRRLTGKASAALVVNDRIDIAEAIGADGVHLGEKSLSVPIARDLLTESLIGRSVHGVPGAVEAEQQGADYLLLGTIFASESHPGVTPAGPHLIRKVKTRVKAPVIAIGGITVENASQAIADGADGVAVIRAILGNSKPGQAAAKLTERVREAWPSAILHRGA
jgi:thiamine-phosphate pyrophosphorylase